MVLQEVFVMRKIRYERVFGCIVLPVLVVICFLAFRQNSNAEMIEGRVDDVVAYESVLVQKGDTLWSIAEANMQGASNAEIRAYVDEIADLNDISPMYIKAGKYIIVPKYNMI